MHRTVRIFQWHVSRKFIFIGFRLLITAVFLFYIARFVTFGEVIETLRQSNFLFLLLYPVIFATYLLMRSLRWQLVIRVFGNKYPFGKAFAGVLEGAVYASITPSKVGDFSRAYRLNDNSQLSGAQSLSTVLIEKVLDLLVLAVSASIGAAFVVLSLDTSMSPFLLFTSGLAVALSAPFLARSSFLKQLSLPLLARLSQNTRSKVRDWGGPIFKGFERLRSQPGILTVTFLLTVAQWFLVFLQAYVVSLAMRMEVGLSIISLFFPIASLASVIPLSLAGLGVREGILLYLLGLVGVEAKTVIGYSVIALFCRYSFLFLGYLAIVR